MEIESRDKKFLRCITFGKSYLWKLCLHKKIYTIRIVGFASFSTLKLLDDLVGWASEDLRKSSKNYENYFLGIHWAGVEYMPDDYFILLGLDDTREAKPETFIAEIGVKGLGEGE